MSLEEIDGYFVHSDYNLQWRAYSLSRILVAKPHSAEVEGLINVSNSLKTKSRNRLNVESEN